MDYSTNVEISLIAKSLHVLSKKLKCFTEK